MATKQTAGQPAKRRSPQAKPVQTRKPGTAKANGKPEVAAAQAKPSATGRLGAMWRGLVSRAGGGVPLATQIVSVLGLADSIYLVIEHFSQSTSFACPENATINCVKVTTSAWSYVPAGPVSWSVPVSVLGLAFFVFMVVINTPRAWRAQSPLVHWARLASVCVGIVMVLYLVWAELFRINAICLFCTGVHLLTFILFALVVGKVTFSGVKAVPARR
jgi:uncharacterized membrane protein